jgi:hypothetical protein
MIDQRAIDMADQSAIIIGHAPKYGTKDQLHPAKELFISIVIDWERVKAQGIDANGVLVVVAREVTHLILETAKQKGLK